MSKTESGYLVKIEVFIPADPRDHQSMVAATNRLAELWESKGEDEPGKPRWSITEPRWVARRKSVPTPSVPACEPAPGVSPIPQVQGRAGDDTPADIPSVSSPAGDMPDIPVALRRVPRT